MIPDQLANSGWSSDRWDQLETRARGVVEHHAHLRKAIPRGPDMLDAYVVELPRNASGNGHGLDSVRRRIAYRYGPHARVQAGPQGDRFVVLLQLPGASA